MRPSTQEDTMDENNPQQYNRRSTDPERAEPVRKAVHVRTISIVAIVIAILLAAIALLAINQVISAENQARHANEEYTTCQAAATDLLVASDYMTTQARMFVITSKRAYLNNYLNELLNIDRRGAAVETMRNRVGEHEAFQSLVKALEQSNELSEIELHAMRLASESEHMDDVPEALSDVTLGNIEEGLADSQKLSIAKSLVLDSGYQDLKNSITESVSTCSDELLEALRANLQKSNDDLESALMRLRIATILLLVVVVLFTIGIAALVLSPLENYVQRIKQNKPLRLKGAYELRFLAEAYNVMYEENQQRTIHLKHAAEHDPLTGLFNRGAYDSLLVENDKDIALLLIDVDKFKDFNDKYGHDVGDEVLKKVARSISSSFRLTDFPCRIGGDEFAVIMTDIDPALCDVVAMKVRNVAAKLEDTSDGLPRITLSIGVAFSNAHPGEEDIYKAADAALYIVKERGRNGFAFYGEE